MVTDCVGFLCSSCGGRVSLSSGPIGDEPIRCPHCGRGHPWDGGILVLGEPAPETDYPEDVYALLVNVEPQHFWFVERNRRIITTLRRVLPGLAGRSMLDVGCGTGFVLAAVEREGMRVCGLDMHLAGLRYARQRTQGLIVCHGATRVPFANEFDVGMLCDVIEHTSDDIAVLRSTAMAVKSGGRILITVPALPFLWTAVDEASGHKRRYTRGTLTTAMRGAGLRVEFVRYFNSALLPAQTIQRLALGARRHQRHLDSLHLLRKDLAVPPALVNWLLGKVARLDAPLGVLGLAGPSLIAVGYVD